MRGSVERPIYWSIATLVMLTFGAAFATLPAAQAQQRTSAADMSEIQKIRELYRRGNFREVIKRGKRLVDRIQKERGVNSIDLGTPLTDMASAHLRLGQLVEAEPLLKRALNVYIPYSQYTRIKISIGITLNSLSELLAKQSRYTEAELLLRRALKTLREGEFAPSEANLQKLTIAKVLNNLAGVRLKRGALDEAEMLYQQALAAKTKHLGKTHQSTAITLNDLAFLSEKRNNQRRALEYYREAIRIFELPPNRDSDRLATATNNLGDLLRRRGDYDKAERLLTKAYDIFKRENNVAQYSTENNLALVYEETNRLEEAQNLLEQILAVREDQLGPDHPEILGYLRNLARLYRNTGQPEKATALQKRIASAPPIGTRRAYLHFATNRSLDNRGKFGAKPGAELIFGTAGVLIGPSEIINSGKRLVKGLGAKHRFKDGRLTKSEALKMGEVKTFSGIRDYIASTKQLLNRSAVFRNKALVFVHGYNTDFDEAMKRATQIAFDLEFDGIVIPFAWPSRGEITADKQDQRRAEQSVAAFVALMDALGTQMPEIKVHVLAHSMGNRIMMRGLCQIARRSNAGGRKRHNLGEVIAAHADVGIDGFAKLSSCVRPLVAGITAYVNENDTALRVRCFGRRCRAGNRARGYADAQTIDTTAMAKGFWRSLTKGFDHDVFVRNPLLFGEITRLLATSQRPPHERTVELRTAKDVKGRTFWRYDPALDIVAKAANQAARR